MNKVDLIAEKRKLTGRKVKQLRREGVLPANIYGRKVKSQEVQVKQTDFVKTYKEVGETGVVTLKIGSEEKPILIHNVQFNPLTNIPIHADFLQIDLKQKVTVEVPLEIAGESPAEKQNLGTVVQYIDEIEVEALPGDFPDKIEISVAGLTDINQTICVKDLPIDTSKLTIKADPDQILVKVEASTKEEVIEAPKETAEEAAQTTGVAPEQPQEQDSKEEGQEKE